MICVSKAPSTDTVPPAGGALNTSWRALQPAVVPAAHLYVTVNGSGDTKCGTAASPDRRATMRASQSFVGSVTFTFSTVELERTSGSMFSTVAPLMYLCTATHTATYT